MHTLYVDAYPRINYGVDVHHTDHFLAGDGPLVAAFTAALGHHSTLISNQVGDDPTGRQIKTRLHGWGVHLAPIPTAAPQTRTNIVVCDTTGNRTWFSGLRGITDELADADITVQPTAVLYVDCYEVLGQAPRPIVTAALDAGADIMVNLGGSPLPPWLPETLAGRRLAVIQTNADEQDPDAAARQLDELRLLDLADTAIVTAGRRGAAASLHDGSILDVSAIAVSTRQVQGAGAAFSAAFLHARDRREPTKRCLQFACAAGSLWCTRSIDQPLPIAEDITTLMHSE